MSRVQGALGGSNKSLALLGASGSRVDGIQGFLHGLDALFGSGDGGGGECTTVLVSAAGLCHGLDERGGSRVCNEVNLLALGNYQISRWKSGTERNGEGEQQEVVPHLRHKIELANNVSRQARSIP